MADFYGSKQKFEDILVPTGQKIVGKIIELKESKNYPGCITATIDFPDHKKDIGNGREITKKGYYLIPLDWTEKNKSGILYYSINGKYPTGDEVVNWSKLLLGRKVAAIFENVLDKTTGEPSGQKISWLGNPNAHVTEERVINDNDLGPSEQVPF